MIAPPVGLRVYLACGAADMHKGMTGLAMLVQEGLAQNPYDGSLYAFRGRRGNLVKLLWHDGIGLCVLSKKLERGYFVWPMTGSGAVSLTVAQLATLMESCEWRAPVQSRRPELAG